MAESTMWFVLAGVLLILEIFTGTFYLMMIALGLAAGGVAALAGMALATNLVCAGVVGVLATLLLRRSRLGKPADPAPARDPNINLDIGQSLTVRHWLIVAGSPATARVKHRGAQWDVELMPGLPPEPGNFVIREIRGSHLIVGRP